VRTHARARARTPTSPPAQKPTRTHTRTHARTRTHGRTHARTMQTGWLAGWQAGRPAGGKLVGRQARGGGEQAEKQAGRKNFGVLLEGVRFIFCTITFAYMRPACRLSRRNLEKVRPPSKVS
jgi:hypothetical protein